MKGAISAISTMTLVMAACSSTDREFDRWCKDKEAKGWREVRGDEKTCSLGDYLTDEEKQQIMRTPSESRGQKARIEAMPRERSD